jgi:hypothetical protein
LVCEALAAKADVKVQVKAGAGIAKERLAQRAQSISESLSDSLPNSTENWEGLSDMLLPLLERSTEYARREPLQANVTVLVLGLFLGRSLRLKRRR